MKRLLLAAAVMFGLGLGNMATAKGGDGVPPQPITATSQPAPVAQDGGVTMMFASDPQFPWWNSIDDDSIIEQSRGAIRRMTSTMDNIQQLGVWPSTLAMGGGAPVARPSGTIINGDLTSFFHKWQYEEYVRTFHLRFTSVGGIPIPQPPPHQVYPGLGNHDYKNNFNACFGTWGAEYFNDTNRCAKEAVWWMANLTQNLPNVVNRDLSGFVTVHNNGGFVARFYVDYADGGTRAAQITDAFEVLQSRTLLIPKTATDINVRVEVHTGFFWRIAQAYHFDTPRASCLDLTGTTFDTSLAALNCQEWPTGSNGSLSYSFDIGNYHFVQLQYRPDYEIDLPDRGVSVFGLPVVPSPGFHVTKSYDWLRADLAAATAAGKQSVINMHDVISNDCIVLNANWNPCNPAVTSVKDDPAFRSAIAGQNVVAVFGGHVHQLFGKVAGDDGYIDNGDYRIPIFHSSSADCERILLADFHRRYFNFASVSTHTGAPEFLYEEKAKCRAGFIVGTNVYDNTSETAPHTFFINRRPSVTGALATSPPREGAALSFNASGSDPDGDALTYTWDFGDDTAEVVGQNVSHVYADNGNYLVKVKARDDFEGVAEYSLTVAIVNAAPVITTAPGPTVNEGQTAAFNVTITDPGVKDTFTLDIDWKDGATTNIPGIPAGTTSYGVSHLYLDDGPGAAPAEVYPVSIRITDKDGATALTNTNVNVRNVSPVVSAQGTAIDEGGTATVTVGIDDPGARDSFTLRVDWSDGNSETVSLPAGTRSRSLSHLYLDDGLTSAPTDVYGVGVEVVDKDGGRGFTSAPVTVRNVNPTVSGVGATIDENQTATISVTVSDPGVRDTFTLTINWKDGSAETFHPSAGATSYSHRYLDDDPAGTPLDTNAVLLSVKDKDGGGAAALANVIVRNVNPAVVIDSLTDEAGQVIGSSDLALVGLPITSRESYADVGTRDWRTATRAWGDGTPVENLGAVTLNTSGTHVYRAEGAYRLALVVTDDDTGVGAVSRAMRVVTPVGATTAAIDNLSRVTSTNAAATRAISDALASLGGQNGGQSNSGALDKLVGGNDNAGLRKLEQAIQFLESAAAADPSLDFTRLKSLLALTAKSVAVAAVARAEATASNPGQRQKVEAAKASLAQGQALLNDRQYAAAVGAFRDAL